MHLSFALGSQWGSNDHLEFTMEKGIKLTVGKTNTISLLSVTVGLQVWKIYITNLFLENNRKFAFPFSLILVGW